MLPAPADPDPSYRLSELAFGYMQEPGGFRTFKFSVQTLLKRTVENRQAVKSQVVADAVRAFGELRLRVTGSSMLPSVWPGDILSVRQCGIAEVRVGDIVLFERDSGLCAHRVVSKIRGTDQTCLITQGHQLPRPDPPVPAEELLGTITLIERGETRLDPRASLGLWTRIASRVLLHSSLATRLMLHLIASRRVTLSKEAEWSI